jgi:hypothetical protein
MDDRRSRYAASGNARSWGEGARLLSSDVCTTHGSRRHTTVHEAGHLLAAVQRGVPYEYVVIHDEPTVLPSGELTSGWVSIDTERVLAVTPVLLLEFALAGQAAEIAILRDRMRDGPKADIANWKRWHRVGMESDPAVFDALVGEPVEQVIERVGWWAHDHAGRIDVLARHLDRCGRMTRHDVDVVLAGA